MCMLRWERTVSCVSFISMGWNKYPLMCLCVCVLKLSCLVFKWMVQNACDNMVTFLFISFYISNSNFLKVRPKNILQDFTKYNLIAVIRVKIFIFNLNRIFSKFKRNVKIFLCTFTFCKKCLLPYAVLKELYITRDK